MTAAAAEMLVKEIMPRIVSAVPRILKRGGSEDDSELIQDGAVQAVDAIESLETRGQPLYASSIAFYTLQRLKSGRRANYAGRADVLSPAAQLDGRSALSSLDEPLPGEGENECNTLHDLLAAPVEGPDEQAARELDWESVLADLDDRQLAILRTVAEGGKLNALARKYRVSPAWVTMLKQGLGGLIKLRMGDGILADATRRPRWVASVYAQQEADACRHARSKAAAW